jgi:hypothetical protein
MNRRGTWRSNCIVEAVREYERRCAQHRPVGREPYLLMRPTRAKAGVIHMLVGEYDPLVDAVRVESFKPVAPVDLPPWLAWKRVRFLGHWAHGDRHGGVTGLRGYRVQQCRERAGKRPREYHRAQRLPA